MLVALFNAFPMIPESIAIFGVVQMALRIFSPEHCMCVYVFLIFLYQIWLYLFDLAPMVSDLIGIVVWP